jgi:ERCC4-type nuclease
MNNTDSTMHKPVLLIDHREKRPLVFTRLRAEAGTLESGDYTVAGLATRFAVERKSVKDLIVCSRGQDAMRFSRELQRLRAFDFARVLIIGAEQAVRANRNAWHFSLESEVRFGVPFVYVGDEARAAALLERWALWYVKVQRDMLTNFETTTHALTTAPK